jgi:nitrogenase molybdenum-iron protein beta chain
MEEGILRYFTLNHMDGKASARTEINIVPGFETYLGNFRVIKRMLAEMVDTPAVGPERSLDTPADGEFRMYAGGTTMDEVRMRRTHHHLLLQPNQLEKTKKVRKTPGTTTSQAQHPMGVEWTDEFLMKVSEVTGKPIPESLAKERGRLVDLISDSHAWLHGKKFALYGDPTSSGHGQDPRSGRRADPHAGHNGNKRWAKRSRSCSLPAPLAMARCTPATTCGTCAACASPTSLTS